MYIAMTEPGFEHPLFFGFNHDCLATNHNDVNSIRIIGYHNFAQRLVGKQKKMRGSGRRHRHGT